MNDCIITLDLDWCPDFVIEYVACLLNERNVKATFFVTHASDAVDQLRETPSLFEIGIHPNFLPGSTHGDSIESVLATCMQVAPEARCMRTHGLMQSTPILERVLEFTPVRTDVSLFLPMQPYIRPFVYEWSNGVLLRVPFFWEDDFEMRRQKPRWTLIPFLNTGPGLKIFDFHPVHIFLNSRDTNSYSNVKKSVIDLRNVSRGDLQIHVQHGHGTRSLFLELLDCLAGSRNSRRICDIKRMDHPSGEFSALCESGCD